MWLWLFGIFLEGDMKFTARGALGALCIKFVFIIQHVSIFKWATKHKLSSNFQFYELSNKYLNVDVKFCMLLEIFVCCSNQSLNDFHYQFPDGYPPTFHMFSWEIPCSLSRVNKMRL